MSKFVWGWCDDLLADQSKPDALAREQREGLRPTDNVRRTYVIAVDYWWLLLVGFAAILSR